MANQTSKYAGEKTIKTLAALMGVDINAAVEELEGELDSKIEEKLLSSGGNGGSSNIDLSPIYERFDIIDKMLSKILSSIEDMSIDVTKLPEPTDFTYETDTSNKIITLIKYTGSATEVDVLSRYNVNGELYHTQIGGTEGLFANNKTVTDIEFEAGVKFLTCEKLLYSCEKLSKVTFNKDATGKVDMSECKSMKEMFRLCSGLTELDLSGFDTSNVTDMSYMFGTCYGLKSLDLSPLDTSNVEDMSYMFIATKLTELDLSGFDFGKVKNITSLFSISTLTNIILPDDINTPNLTNMSYMFNNSANLTSEVVNSVLSKFNVTNVTNMSRMFANCTGLVEPIDLTTLETSELTSISYMFNGCSNITNVIFSDKFKTDKVTTMSNMFNGCTNIGEELDLTMFDNHSLTSDSSIEYMFSKCSNLKRVLVSNDKWNGNIGRKTLIFNAAGCSDFTYV